MADKDDEPELKIASREDLEAWLEDKPADWARVIAVRSALRVFPFIVGYSTIENRLSRELPRKSILLECFRSSFSQWAVYFYPYAKIIRQKIYASSFSVRGSYSEGLNPGADLAAVRPFGHSYACITKALQSVVVDKQAREFALEAVIQAARAFISSSESHLYPFDFWESVSADAQLLDRRVDVGGIASSRLWPMNAPIGSVSGSSTYSKMKLELSVFSESDQWPGPWKLIVDWYRAILSDDRGTLPRSAFDKDSDIAIATQPPEFWERDPDEVMADISRIVDGKPTLFDLETQEPSERMSRETADKAVDDVVEPEIVEDTRTQFDHPTDIDRLERRPFALELVRRMDEMRAQNTPDGFALNLHGPWGAGKSSILLMMDKALRDRGRATGEPWAVVHFNAWQHERRTPPWWPLIQGVRRSSSSSLFKLKTLHRWAWLKIVWFWWWLLGHALPFVIATCAALGLTVFFWPEIADFFFGETAALSETEARPQGEPDGVKVLESLLKIATSGAAVFGIFVLVARALVFGSADGAKFYFDLSRDPLSRVKKLFSRVVRTSNRHVCIFIDDLDRCNADFVVDLLEGIQTSFRHEKVAYVIAADKAWIRAAFEARYPEFADHVGNPGQPLGYLFLEKIFQMSIPLPGMGARKAVFFDGLLAPERVEDEETPALPESFDDLEAFDEKVEERRGELRARFGLNPGRRNIDEAFLQTDPEDAVGRAALVAEESVSDTVKRETEHLLRRFAGLLPDNPRVMKRMINAFGMRRMILTLEGSTVAREVLARWTVLEQRFPALADLLAEHPDAAGPLAASSAESADIPADLKPFAEVPAVQAILAGPLKAEAGEGIDAPPLDAEAVRKIVRGAIG